MRIPRVHGADAAVEHEALRFLPFEVDRESPAIHFAGDDAASASHLLKDPTSGGVQRDGYVVHKGGTFNGDHFHLVSYCCVKALALQWQGEADPLCLTFVSDPAQRSRECQAEDGVC